MSKGTAVLAGAIGIVAVLAVGGYLAWQRWQQSASGESAESLTTTSEPVAEEPQPLRPAVDPGVAPVVPAVPQPPPGVKAPVRMSTSTVAAIKPQANLEPLPSPVPPTMITPQLTPASPEVQAKPATAPPVVFGDAKWMRVDGTRVRETTVFLQFTDADVRLLDARARDTLLRIPFSAIAHVTYSSGKRPLWRKDTGPVPTEAAFDSTVRTFHYLAFQGASQFVLVRVDKDDLPRVRDELKKRANLAVDTAQ